MFKFVVTQLSFLFFNALALAQSTGAPILVKVGADGLVYTPSSIKASNGTVVNFLFSDVHTMHSVTQSTFAAPCTHLKASDSVGFNSGTQVGGSFFNITITDDSKPIWFYCNIGNHCGSGMVGSVNAPDTKTTYDAFHAAAVALGSSEPAQSDANIVQLQGVGASASALPSGPSPTSAIPTSTPHSGATRLTFCAGTALIIGAAAMIATQGG